MKPVIKVEGISKSYTINHKDRAAYGTIKDDFTNFVKHPFSKKESSEEKFWALNDVSFEVNKGEIFGIIGKNGSGKSTLLKILSRIIAPDSGKIELHGKTASLLEVGTGFHPDLTGRENVYFNGSMLGMKRSEITRKFQEIVDFSEIEKFIDTPVKFYSSGMYVRLAFAVAAHLEPDILILDEVLAVGDASFQKKSMAKILSTMKEGRTVLFVSHSTSIIRQLCTSGILLNQGEVQKAGKISDIIDEYALELDAEGSKLAELKYTWHNNVALRSDAVADIVSLKVCDKSGRTVSKKLPNTDDYFVHLEVDINKPIKDLMIGYALWDSDARTLIYQTFVNDAAKTSNSLLASRQTFKSRLPRYLLNAGSYRIYGLISVYGKDWVYDPETSPARILFELSHGKRETDKWTEPRGGLLSPVMDWEKG